MIRGARTRVYNNCDEVIETILRQLGDGCGSGSSASATISAISTTSPSFSTAPAQAAGFCPRRLWIQRRDGADPENLMHVRRIAGQAVRRRLPLVDSGDGAAPDGPLHRGAVMGANVRVGLEDSLYLGKGTLARSNADQVDASARSWISCRLMLRR